MTTTADPPGTALAIRPPSGLATPQAPAPPPGPAAHLAAAGTGGGILAATAAAWTITDPTGTAAQLLICAATLGGGLVLNGAIAAADAWKATR